MYALTTTNPIMIYVISTAGRSSRQGMGLYELLINRIGLTEFTHPW
jgi:hypothetical protein